MKKNSLKQKFTEDHKTLEDVREFWESHPLFTGESTAVPGSEAFFKQHRQIYIDDCFAGHFDLKTLPPESNRNNVLDLGCGIGFWVIELQNECLKSGTPIKKFTAADLTQQALNLTKKRLKINNLDADLKCENAENLSFSDETFDHVNCQGVIHHTPDTEKTISEIARVLKPGGTASLSVYYKNVIHRNWHWFGKLGTLFSRMGFGLKGRGRETMIDSLDDNEIIRRYDGMDNPIGKGYSKQQFIKMLEPYFEVTDIYYHFFPARALPFKMPKFAHRILDQMIPFMIYVNLRKK